MSCLSPVAKQTPLLLRSAMAERFTKLASLAVEAVSSDRSALAER